MIFTGPTLGNFSRTCGHLSRISWAHNPYITRLDENDAGVEVIDCHYPLINQSNTTPCHFLHGFPAYLNDLLGLRIRVTDFKGDIHIADEERLWFSELERTRGATAPFWLLVSGGKLDYTIKWWDHDRYQDVVDHFQGRIQFVQVGETSHHHPSLRGVVDLRGQTTLRQLIRLMYHAQGAISPVSLLMHLAAAVETPPGAPRNRPCVVVAGGREPPHFTAYPHHQFIHTVGALALLSMTAAAGSRGRCRLATVTRRTSPGSSASTSLGRSPVAWT